MDGAYGGIGGSPWTDINTFLKNGQITAMEIRAGSEIDAIRARYLKKVIYTFSCKIYEYFSIESNFFNLVFAFFNLFFKLIVTLRECCLLFIMQ